MADNLARNLYDTQESPDDNSADQSYEKKMHLAKIESEIKQTQQNERRQQNQQNQQNQNQGTQAKDPADDKKDFKPYDEEQETKKGGDKTKEPDKKDSGKISSDKEQRVSNELKKQKLQLANRHRTLKKEKQRRTKGEVKSDSLFNATQRSVLNIAKYLPIIGSLICAIDSGVDNISSMAEKPLQAVLKSVKTLIRLMAITRKVGSMVDGIRSWAQTIGITLETIIIPILVFLTFPIWIIIYPTLDLGPISSSIRPAEMKLKKIKEKIEALILKVRTTKNIDMEMSDIRRQLKNLNKIK